MVVARSSVAWLAALIGCADGVAVDPVIACRDAGRAHHPDALASCAAVFAQTGAPAAGGGLARALLDAHSPEQLEAIALDVGDRGGADAWAAVGERRRAQGEFDTAEVAFQRALEHRGDDEGGRVMDAYALARLYDARGDEHHAIELAATAYDGLRRVADPEPRAYVLVGIAAMMYEMGDLQATEALVAEAEPSIGQDSSVWGSYRDLKALVDRARGRTKLARRELTEAATWAADHKRPELERRARLSVVMLELAEGDGDRAAAALATIPLPSNLNDRMHRAYVAELVAYERGDLAQVLETEIDPQSDFAGGMQAVRGRALARLGRDQEAEVALLDAIAAFERDRESVAFDALKSWTIDGPWKRSAFEDLFALYAKLGRTVDAFAVVQRATARSVLDVLASQSRGGPVYHELARASARMDVVRALTKALRTSTSTPLPSGDELLRRVANRHVLTYFRSRDDLWLIDSHGAKLRLLRVGRIDEIGPLAAAWLAHPDELRLADELGTRLLPNLLVIPPGERLHVAVDDPIREIPFAALRRGGAFVVERNPMAFVPSAAVLAALDAMPVRAGPPVVIGDPTGDLPSARREAAEVAAAIGAQPWIGSAATRERMFAATGAAVLHVAAHSDTAAGGPELVLADGRVGAGEIIDRGLSAELVVLASCASADPTQRAELGPLASAFVAAGTQTVVASRWTVADEIALAFSRTFYASDGVRDPIAATASAQRDLIRKGVPLASWSTFVVYGGRLETKRGAAR